MTKEEKELLINDICPRLPYGVKCEVCFKDAEGYKIIDMSLKGVFTDECYFTTDGGGSMYSSDFKPYLRPLSSMTEEEKKEYGKVCELDTEILANHPMNGEPFPALYNSQDWLNKNMFDYRGLIPRGLALEAKEGMYNN